MLTLRQFIIFAILLFKILSIGPNFVSSLLNQLIEARDYQTILSQICPVATRQGDCAKKFWSETKVPHPVVTVTSQSKNLDRRVLNYNNLFVIKEYEVFDQAMQEYALYEINLGLKIFESLQNGIDNLMEMQDCCSEVVSRAFKKGLKFFMKSHYCPQGNLRNFMSQHQEMTENPEWKMSIAAGLLNGVLILNTHGYAHRDLKPENVIIQNTYTPLLNDYGYSKKMFGTADTLVGTAIYLPPEVRNGKAYTSKVDVYTSGIVLFEIFNSNGYSITQTPAQDIRGWCQPNGQGQLDGIINPEKFNYCAYFRPLVEAMIEEDPEKRIDITVAKKAFDEAVKKLIIDNASHINEIVERVKILGLSKGNYWESMLRSIVDFNNVKLLRI